jgi:hypothetical protein
MLEQHGEKRLIHTLTKHCETYLNSRLLDFQYRVPPWS